MRRLLALTLGIATLSGVGASTALAAEIPTSQQPYHDAGKVGAFATLLRTGDTTTLISNATPEQLAKLKASGLVLPDGTPSAARWRGVARHFTRTAMAAKAFPALGAIGNVLIIGTAIQYEWRIANHPSNPGGYIYKRLTGESYGGTLPAGTPGWSYQDGASTSIAYFFSGSVLPEGWYLDGDISTVAPYAYCVPNTGNGCNKTVEWNDLAAAFSGTAHGATSGSSAGNTYCGSGVATTYCFLKSRTSREMETAVDIEDSNAGSYAASGNQKNTTATVPGQLTATDLANGRAVLDGATKDTRDTINVFIDSSYVPDTTTASGTTTTTPTHVLPPVTTVPPPADGVDFTPITDLDGECSFPFGFICYAQDVTATFDVTADAPRFELDVAIPALAGGGSIDYNVDLNVMDEYLAMLRGLISFVLWIGAVYFLAVNLLGFRSGGDPSETADEALHV